SDFGADSCRNDVRHDERAAAPPERASPERKDRRPARQSPPGLNGADAASVALAWKPVDDEANRQVIRVAFLDEAPIVRQQFTCWRRTSFNRRVVDPHPATASSCSTLASASRTAANVLPLCPVRRPRSSSVVACQPSASQPAASIAA